MTTDHTYLFVPAGVPTAYFDDYFTWSHADADLGDEASVWVSVRTGKDAESDLQYVIDRCASGLHMVRGAHDWEKG